MNKNFVFLFSALICSGILAAQTQSLPPSYQKNLSNPISVYRAEPERINNLVHTKLDLKFDYAKQLVLGEAWITLEPHFYPTAILQLDAKAMLIHKVELVEGSKRKKLKFKYDGLELTIDLDHTYKKGESYTVYIDYTAQPNEVKQEGSQAINDAKGIYFINPEAKQAQVPTQIWTQGESESSSCWFPTIDKTNQKTTQEIYLTYPQKYVSLSNGTLVSTTQHKNGTKTDYWKMGQKHAPYLFFIGIGDYAVVKDKWRNIDVDYYVEPEYKDYAQEIFGDTPAMMEFFSNLLDYPYPWEKYAQMTAREYVSGAMENTTASLFNDGVQQKPGQLIDENSAETVIAHELFHHWFGDLVTAESWSNLAMNEAFANYSEYLWTEHKYGKEKADQYLYNEVESYKNGENFDKNLVRMHYHSQEDMFDQVTYNKGGAILHMLRNYLGDEAFFKGLSKYLKDNEFGKAEYTQLRLALEAVSGRDLNWFFNQWFLGSGQPSLIVKSDYDSKTKKAKVTITQRGQKFFEFPYALDIVIAGKTKRESIWVSAMQHNSFEFNADKKPDVIIYNADQVLLSDLQDDDKSIAEYQLQYRASKGNYLARRQAVEVFAEEQSSNAMALTALLEALNDDNDGIRELAISSIDQNVPSVVEKALPILKTLAKTDPKTKIQAQAIASLNYMGDYDEPFLESAAKSVSFRVQAAAIDGILMRDPTKFSRYKEGLDQEVIKNSEQLTTLFIPVWVAENDLTKADLVIQTAAFYLFAKTQNAPIADQLEKGFTWVMSNDTEEATKIAVQMYTMYYAYIKSQSEAASALIKTMARNAADLKKSAYEKDKLKNTNLKAQYEMLQGAVEKMN